MFIDRVKLTLSAGKGGNGVVAWRREKFIPKGGPAGGDGGNGASIILRADPQILSLQDFRNRRLIRADNGEQGGGNNRQGKTGKDLILKVPCGTLVKNATTQAVLFDLTAEGQQALICQGGRGGKGNSCFKSPTHQAPNVCTPGTFGESCEVELELKLIADVGLIGMPNAGKSTLLSQLAAIDVKIGAYPFTTLHPNLSYIQFQDFSRLFIADIPGIIENAHLDKGLGLAFLKHIERSSALVYIIDISGIEERDPIEDFLILQRELGSYDKALLEKPYLIALNKIDLENAQEQAERFRNTLQIDPSRIFAISALEKTGLPALARAMRKAMPTPVPAYAEFLT